MVQAGFYAWAGVALAMVFYMLSQSGKGKTILYAVAVGLTVWIGYVVVLSRIGILSDFSFPPRLPLLIVIPAVVFSIYITGRSTFREVLKETPPYLPVYFQSFRIVVEFLIFGAFLEGAFPERATFKGLNYDIVVGASAPLVAFLVQKRKLACNGLLIWNVIAMGILSVTVYAFISTYYFTDYVSAVGNTDFVKLPYLLLASVLLPVAVFLHVFSLRQIAVLRC